MTSQDTHTLGVVASIQASGTKLFTWGQHTLSVWLRPIEKANLLPRQNTKQRSDSFLPSADEGLAARQELERMFLRRI